MRRLLTLLLTTLLLAVACGGEAAPTALSPTAQATEAATAAPLPTATASATASPVPTTTATATATPIPATPTATATATPDRQLYASAEDFGETRNPFTGEIMDDPDVLQRRPLAVKISNYPGGYVRPQSGLSQADIVYEHLTEGAITRFTALFYSQLPPDVGPIRSGRLIDLEIPVMYDAAFAYSGSSIGVAYKLGEASWRDRILRGTGYFRTGEEIPYEHTLYGNPEQWHEVLVERGLERAPQLNNYMAFSAAPPEGGEAAEEIHIAYRDVVTVDWRYDEESGRYWRWTDDEPHVDQNTDEQLSSANVVIIFAPHQTDYSICETQVGDQCLAFSEEIQIWGEGEAIIIRDGRQFAARWQRATSEEMLTFVDEDGEPVPLKIGNSWFQVLPTYYVDPVTIKP